MFLELDGNGPQYAQLTRAMKSAILSGRMPAGSRLPPTRVLAGELALSRTTVLAAYEQLRAEGFIEGRVGSGSYVAQLQRVPALQSPSHETSAPSLYAARARQVQDRKIAVMHRGLRYHMQYGETIINPMLNSAWARELARAAIYMPTTGAGSQGLPALRQQVCEYLSRRRGVQARPEDVLIVNGAQQAFSLAARVLLNEGDTAVLEDPHYFGAYQTLVAHGARICSVRTDDDGLVCSELPSTAPSLVCVTPSHQFPTGAVLSLSRRLELLRYADAQRCWILEDDYDGEFRYDARPLAALRSLDQADRVIYVGTFSKVLFGTLRLAYMVLPMALRDDFIVAKHLNDFSCAGFQQAALAHYMEDGGFERHLRMVRRELRTRNEELVKGLRRHAGERVEIVQSAAGMHVVVWFRDYDKAQTDALLELASSRGLGMYSMAPHYSRPPRRQGLLLGYCGLSVGELREATKLLGVCMDEIDSRLSSARASSPDALA